MSRAEQSELQDRLFAFAGELAVLEGHASGIREESMSRVQGELVTVENDLVRLAVRIEEEAERLRRETEHDLGSPLREISRMLFEAAEAVEAFRIPVAFAFLGSAALFSVGE